MYSLLLQQPDSPITEKWLYRADEIIADDGTEQRLQLAPIPKRSWAGRFSFSDEASIRRHIATMFGAFKGYFDWPHWTAVVKLKAKVTAGAGSLYCNTRRSDFKPGARALIVEGGTFEIVTIDNVFTDHLTLVGTTSNAYSARGFICPILIVYSNENAAFSRSAPNKVASASFGFIEYAPILPFIAEDDKVELEMFGGYPVLNRHPIGSDFAQSLISGIDPTDYGAQASLRARLNNSQLTFPVTFHSDRIVDPDDWFFWKTFADYCRGGTNPFYMPSWRNDLAVHTEAVAAGTTVVLEGREWGDHYWPAASFRKIVFRTEAGLEHFATVTARAVVGGNDSLTFDPPLPAGDWAGHIVGTLLKCRISDDTVTSEHLGTSTNVSLNLRTVP